MRTGRSLTDRLTQRRATGASSSVDFADVDRQVEEITRSLMFHYAEGGDVKLTARTIAPSSHTLQSFSAANTTRRGSTVALSSVRELGGGNTNASRGGPDRAADSKVSSVGIEMTSFKDKNRAGGDNDDDDEINERTDSDSATVFV